MTKIIVAAIVIGLLYPLIRSKKLRTRDEKGRIIGTGWLTALIVTVGLFLSLLFAAGVLGAEQSRFEFIDTEGQIEMNVKVTVVVLKTPIKYEGEKITTLKTQQAIVGDSLWISITDLYGRKWMIPRDNVSFTVEELRFVPVE